jgi:uncharacterized membrane protein
VSDRARGARVIALAAWLLLAASIAAWPLGRSGIGWWLTAIALVPLALPLAGMLRGSPHAWRAASMALAPALVVTVMECLANPAARLRTGVSLALVFIAFAGLIGAIRTAKGSEPFEGL